MEEDEDMRIQQQQQLRSQSQPQPRHQRRPAPVNTDVDVMSAAGGAAMPASMPAPAPHKYAPAVWIAPEWAAYPIIENFYGHAPRARVNSFFEVMCSPTNNVPTTTLAENCCTYDAEDDGSPASAASAGGAGPGAAIGSKPTRKLGSFSYSYSTETSDEASPSPFGHAGFSASDVQDVHAVRGRGFTAWNRIRRTQGDGGTEFVPVPTSDLATRNAAKFDRKGASRRGTRRLENPQAGSGDVSPTSSSESQPGSPVQPATTGRLRTKLHECLLQIDLRIQVERDLAIAAHQSLKKSLTKTTRGNFMWNLLCGATTAETTQSDGLNHVFDRLTVAVHNRALNQLQRHRRHVNGILQIVTSHNPDLELTEKQLDSFETAEAMLANDIKYSLLKKQVDWLGVSLRRRREAQQDAKLKNGSDCFDNPRVKVAMMTKLLEAVSWYRLVQTSSRDESASSSVGIPPSTKSSAGHEGELEASAALSSSVSASRSLQEIQVEKILNVLAGEDFYSDYNDLMCQPEWWDIAQAHFENLIFSRADSRICQWISRLGRDVIEVSHEDLEDAQSLGIHSPTKPKPKNASVATAQERARSFSDGMAGYGSRAIPFQQSEWMRDPTPEQILDFVDKLSRRIRREFDVPSDVSKSLSCFIQRTVFPRMAVLCFTQKAIRDCQRKDKLWRKRCVELSGIPMEQLNVPVELADKIRSQLPSRRLRSSTSAGARVYFVRAIEAFNGMNSIVPCDLLDELMHGVVILHHEAALVLGTTQFSVETFFPLLAYVLMHCHLPRVHAQLHLLESYAITNSNANGEESYYVYCVHAAVEYVCNSATLNPATPVSSPPSKPMPTATPDPAITEVDALAT